MNDVQLTGSPVFTPQTDLFDSLDTWLKTPEDAFPAWLSRQRQALSTRRVRLSMWKKFIRYLESIKVTIPDCKACHVAGFIDSAGLEKEHAWRYIKLIEAVYVHLDALGLIMQNPGRLAGQQHGQIQKNDPMHFLEKTEEERLIHFLQLVLLEAQKEYLLNKGGSSVGGLSDVVWAVVRDAAAAAVLVGSGVKTGELVGLSVNCTLEPGVLLIPTGAYDNDGHAVVRRAPLLPIAQLALEVWLPLRGPSSSLGNILFPAMLARRRKGQLTPTAAMHPATLFRRVQLLLNQVEISGARACGQTLRNTYAASLIESGIKDAELARAMGYTLSMSVSRLRQEHTNFIQATLLQPPYRMGVGGNDDLETP